MPNTLSLATFPATGWPSPPFVPVCPTNKLADDAFGAASGTPGAGAILAPGMPIYKDVTTGQWWPCDATGGSHIAKTNCWGQAAQLVQIGETVTLLRGALMWFPTTATSTVVLAPGTPIYLSASVVGAYDDTAPFSGAPIVGVVWEPNLILFRSMPF